MIPIHAVHVSSLLLTLAFAAPSWDVTEQVGARPAVCNESSEFKAVSIPKLLFVRPFVVKTGYVSDWQAERPRVDRGLLIVLASDPDVARPRAAAGPVLQAGTVIVERLNLGYPSGVIVGIVPDLRDLGGVPIFFGAPELPERLNRLQIEQRVARAWAQGIRPFSPEVLERAAFRSMEPLVVENKSQLVREGALLMQEHCPDEADLADALLGRIPGAKTSP